jgi:hypothetical protein
VQGSWRLHALADAEEIACHSPQAPHRDHDENSLAERRQALIELRKYYDETITFFHFAP